MNVCVSKCFMCPVMTNKLIFDRACEASSTAQRMRVMCGGKRCVCMLQNPLSAGRQAPPHARVSTARQCVRGLHEGGKALMDVRASVAQWFVELSVVM